MFGRIWFAWASFLLLLPIASSANVEPFWGAREFTTQHGRLRYLLLFPAQYDPHKQYSLWVNLHGSPGCASHAIFLYREQALRRDVFLLAPQATGWTSRPYTRPDGKHNLYHAWDMRRDRDTVFTVLDEVTRRYPIERKHVVLLGFSAGCEMGWRLIAARPEAFCFFGGVANGFKCGRPPADPNRLRIAARRVPHFYAAGRSDSFGGPLFPETERKLRQYGFELRTAYPAGVGHALPPSIQNPLLAFLDEVMAGKTYAAERRRHAPPAPVYTHPVRKRAVLIVGAGGILLNRLLLLRFRGIRRRS